MKSYGSNLNYIPISALVPAIPDMSGMARAERKSVYVLHIPDVSGMAGTRALIGMQLRFDPYDFIYP